jgi:hypothetical protein
MAKLSKTILTTYIPADPGSPGSAGTAPTAGYWVKDCTTSTAGCITTTTPIYQYPCPPEYSGNLAASTGSCLIGYKKETQCWEAKTTCVSYYVPPSAGTAAVPARPPTPAQVIQNFQEGWNASAQSIQSLMPGKAALFQIRSGSRGILLGFAPEQWTPRVNTMEHGVMFHDGKADVYENGVFKEALGNFTQSQEFLVGRSLDNYVVYINKASGHTVVRKRSPAAPTVPIHVFALLYYGGDTVLI